MAAQSSHIGNGPEQGGQQAQHSHHALLTTVPVSSHMISDICDAFQNRLGACNDLSHSRVFAACSRQKQAPLSCHVDHGMCISNP